MAHHRPTNLSPPYYAVVFSSVRRPSIPEYAAAGQRMTELTAAQPGFLGIEELNEGQRGITISYWADLDSIQAWKKNAEHQMAQAKGQKFWYERFELKVARVAKAYGFEAS